MNKFRTNHGVMGSMLFLSLILIGALLGCLATDFAHMNTVKEELQNAVDAAALAGAQDLWTKPNDAAQNAKVILERNSADGKRVVKGQHGIDTTINVTAPMPPATPGRVEVMASIPVRNMFGCLLGRYNDFVTARGVAGTNGKLKTAFANQIFPLAVNPYMVPPKEIGGQSIASMKQGDTIRLYINSQQWKNSAWTSVKHKPASAKYIDDAIEGLLGLKTLPPGYIASVAVGDSIEMNNGVISEKSLTKGEERAVLLNPDSPPITFPLVNKEPPFNGDAEVIGFISIKPTNVIVGDKGGMVESIVGTIEYTQVKGEGGNATTSLASIEPGPIQLIE